MRLTIYFGRKDDWKDEPRGSMGINLEVWMKEKGSVRDFRKILKLCQESDRLYETITVMELREFLEASPARIRQKAREITKDYNCRCEDTRQMYDNPGIAAEKKRGQLKQMEKELRQLKQMYDRCMKNLSAELKQSKKLLEEVEAVCLASA